MDVSNDHYRTLESLSTRHYCHHHHLHHNQTQNHPDSIRNSWKQHLLADDIENTSSYTVDEIEDECFHTSDFEPFSDDEELELSSRLLSIETQYPLLSGISSLEHVLFRQPFKQTTDKYESGCYNGNRFCNGVVYLCKIVDGEF